MTTLGVFRDDYYDPAAILPRGQYTSTAQASGTLPASIITGAQEVFLVSTTATALTTDTAANIVAAITASLQANSTGAYPPPSIMNVGFNYVLNVRSGAALTLTGGTGVTITGLATVASGAQRRYLASVTGLASVVLQDLGGFAVT